MGKPQRNFSDASKHAPSRELHSPTYTKYHLAMARGAFDQIHSARSNGMIASPDGRRVLEVMDPSADDFLYHLQRVGHIYGWDKRKKYQPENKPFIETMIKEQNARLFIFEIDNQEAGFCLITDTQNSTKPKQGISKESAIEAFKRQRQLANNSNAVEIYKFGLQDEFTNQGHGHYFLARILDTIFNKAQKDIVYLDTRDTNHSGVLGFYQRNGIDTFYQEELNNDLVLESPKWPETRPHGQKEIEPAGQD